MNSDIFPDPFGLMKDIFDPSYGGTNDFFGERNSSQGRGRPNSSINDLLKSQHKLRKKFEEAQRRRQQQEEEQRLLQPRKGINFGFGKSLDAPIPGQQKRQSSIRDDGLFGGWSESVKNQTIASRDAQKDANRKNPPPSGRISGKPEDI